MGSDDEKEEKKKKRKSKKNKDDDDEAGDKIAASTDPDASGRSDKDDAKKSKKLKKQKTEAEGDGEDDGEAKKKKKKKKREKDDDDEGDDKKDAGNEGEGTDKDRKSEKKNSKSSLRVKEKLSGEERSSKKEVEGGHALEGEEGGEEEAKEGNEEVGEVGEGAPEAEGQHAEGEKDGEEEKEDGDGEEKKEEDEEKKEGDEEEKEGEKEEGEDGDGDKPLSATGGSAKSGSGKAKSGTGSKPGSQQGSKPQSQQGSKPQSAQAEAPTMSACPAAAAMMSAGIRDLSPETQAKIQMRDRYGNAVDRRPSNDAIPAFSERSPKLQARERVGSTSRSPSPGKYNRDPSQGPVADYRTKVQQMKNQSNIKTSDMSPRGATIISQAGMAGQRAGTGPLEAAVRQQSAASRHRGISGERESSPRAQLAADPIGTTLKTSEMMISPGIMPPGILGPRFDRMDTTITGNPEVKKFLANATRPSPVHGMEKSPNMGKETSTSGLMVLNPAELPLEKQQALLQLGLGTADAQRQLQQLTQIQQKVANSFQHNQRKLKSPYDDVSIVGTRDVEVARPITPPEVRYQQVAPRVYDNDYSAKQRQVGGPEHWNEKFQSELRQNFGGPDELLKPSHQPPGRAAQPAQGGHRDDFAPSKYILNPAYLPLKEFIDTTVKQFRQWQVLNDKNLSIGDQKIIDSIIKGLSNKLTQVEFEVMDKRAAPPRAPPASGSNLPPVLRKSSSNNSNPNKIDLAQAIESKQIVAPLCKPMKRMEPKIYERIRRGLTETFCYYARSDVNYDPYAPPKWISTRQWVMFLRGFEMSAITGLSFSDLIHAYGPKREPIEFLDFMEMLSAIGKKTIELLQAKSFDDLNIYHEEPKTLALYRFTEVFGFHDPKNGFRQFLRGREKIRYKERANATQSQQQRGKSPTINRGLRDPSPNKRDPNVFPTHLQARPPPENTRNKNKVGRNLTSNMTNSYGAMQQRRRDDDSSTVDPDFDVISSSQHTISDKPPVYPPMMVMPQVPENHELRTQSSMRGSPTLDGKSSILPPIGASPFAVQQQIFQQNQLQSQQEQILQNQQAILQNQMLQQAQIAMVSNQAAVRTLPAQMVDQSPQMVDHGQQMSHGNLQSQQLAQQSAQPAQQQSMQIAQQQSMPAQQQQSAPPQQLAQQQSTQVAKQQSMPTESSPQEAPAVEQQQTQHPPPPPVEKGPSYFIDQYNNKGGAVPGKEEEDDPNYYWGDDGGIYYYDPNTGESTWVEPADAPAKFRGETAAAADDTWQELAANDASEWQENSAEAAGAYYDDEGGYYDGEGGYYDPNGQYFPPEGAAWA